MIRNNITEVAYNVQSTVDSKHCIPIDYKVTNENESKAMGNMVLRTYGTWHKELTSSGNGGQLYSHEEGNEKGELRCGVYVYGI
jgi:hypothetical protein